jgi:hypothetical protein
MAALLRGDGLLQPAAPILALRESQWSDLAEDLAIRARGAPISAS